MMFFFDAIEQQSICRNDSKDIKKCNNMIKNQTLFEIPVWLVPVKESFDVFDSIEIIIKLLDTFTGGIIIVFHSKKDDVLVVQIIKVHSTIDAVILNPVPTISISKETSIAGRVFS